MKLRTIMVATVLALTPGAILAQGCPYGHAVQETMSCAEGSIWDATAGSCVPLVTG